MARKAVARKRSKSEIIIWVIGVVVIVSMLLSTILPALTGGAF
jgi:hypothetical protein